MADTRTICRVTVFMAAVPMAWVAAPLVALVVVKASMEIRRTDPMAKALAAEAITEEEVAAAAASNSNSNSNSEAAGAETTIREVETAAIISGVGVARLVRNQV